MIVDYLADLDATGRCTFVRDVAAIELAADIAAPSSWREAASRAVVGWQVVAIEHRRWVESGASIGPSAEHELFRTRYGDPHVPLSAIRVTTLAGGFSATDCEVLQRESENALRVRGVPAPWTAAAATAWFERVQGMTLEGWWESRPSGPEWSVDGDAREQDLRSRIAALKATLVPQRRPLR